MKVSDILNSILTLCNQYGAAGARKTTSVEDYKARILFISDIGQREIMQAIRFTKKQKYSLTKASGDGFRAIELPLDCGQIRGLYENGRNRLNDDSFSYRDEKELYVVDDFGGELVAEYIPNPAPIDSSDTEFTLDDAAVNALIFYNASFLLIDQNPNRASFYQEKYEEQIRELKKRKIGSVKPVINVYGG